MRIKNINFFKSLSKKKLYVGLFILPLSLDFHGASKGGGYWQYLLSAVSIFAWFSYVVQFGINKPKSKLWKFSFFSIFITIIGSLVTFIVNDVQIANYIRVIFPFVLFSMSLMVSSSITYACNVDYLNRLVFVGCFISVVFSLLNGLNTIGYNFYEVRYQILSPVILIFESILLSRIAANTSRRFFEITLLLFCLLIQLLSVTRSSILGLLLVAAASSFVRSSSIKVFILNLLSLFSKVFLFVTLLATVVFFVSPFIINRWIGRSFAIREAGIDPTTISRVAEMVDQLDKWSETSISVLLGKGYGGKYSWSQFYQFDLINTGSFTSNPFASNYFEFGHNYWVSSLFSGGILFGLFLPLLMSILAYSGLKGCRQLFFISNFKDLKISTLCSTLVIVSFFGVTIGGNPLGDRYSSLMYGIYAGILVVLLRKLDLLKKLKNKCT